MSVLFEENNLVIFSNNMLEEWETYVSKLMNMYILLTDNTRLHRAAENKNNVIKVEDF